MRKKNILALFLIVFTVMLSSFAFYTYQILYTPNLLVDTEGRYFPVSKGTTFKEFQNQMDEDRIVQDLVSFSFLAKIKGLDENLKAGMYFVETNMTNLEAINMFRAGRQVPVQLTFSNARKLEDLPKKLAKGLAIDSAKMAKIMLDPATAEHYGFNRHTFICMFIPNTYEVYWTFGASDILDRLKMEYDRFWNDERMNKSKALDMTPVEIAILASIVQSETNYIDEAPTIAGVYVNRLQRGIPLQADPTLVYAIGDFGIRRILDKDKAFDSPYNTYKYKGLPPGPIRMPDPRYIDAVLNFEGHKYLYFCAKADFSGQHVFAKTLAEHNANAKKFQQALNKEKIYR